MATREWSVPWPVLDVAGVGVALVALPLGGVDQVAQVGVAAPGRARAQVVGRLRPAHPGAAGAVVDRLAAPAHPLVLGVPVEQLAVGAQQPGGPALHRGEVAVLHAGRAEEVGAQVEGAEVVLHVALGGVRLLVARVVRQPVVGPAGGGVHEPGVEAGLRVDVEVLDEQAGHRPRVGHRVELHRLGVDDDDVLARVGPAGRGRRVDRVEAGVAVLAVVQDLRRPRRSGSPRSARPWARRRSRPCRSCGRRTSSTRRARSTRCWRGGCPAPGPSRCGSRRCSDDEPSSSSTESRRSLARPSPPTSSAACQM